MSKRFWIPTRKGTELQPKTSQQPTKLVIRDVPAGTPLHDAVVQRFGGQLKQFHGKAQQDYSLSETQQYRRHIEWSGARATYTNQFGNETLELEVDTHVLTELRQQAVQWWDFALIEIYVPDMHFDAGAMTLMGVAHMVTPREANLDASSTWPVDGVALSWTSRPQPDRMVNAAGGATSATVERVVTYTGPESYASFTVDLQPARGLPIVSVDLYAKIDVSNSLPVAHTLAHSPYELLGVALLDTDYGIEYDDSTADLSINRSVCLHTADGFLVGAGEYPGTIIRQNINTDGSLSDIAAIPAVHFDKAALQWVFDTNNTPYYADLLGPLYRTAIVGGVTTQEIDTGPYFEYFHVVTGTIPAGPLAYDGPSTVPALVQTSVFKGVPPLISDYYTHTVTPPFTPSYFRWDYNDIFPARAGAAVLAHVNLQTNSGGDDQLVDFFGIPKLGTVTIDLHTGGAFWQRAT